MDPIKRGNRRLLKLAKFLEKVPRERFDYKVWVGNDWKGKSDLSCGTTACALGWATTMPEFRRLGLRLNPRWLYSHASGEEYISGGAVGMADYAPGVERDIFSLENWEFSYLFIPTDKEGKATPKQVAKKIREFVEARAAGQQEKFLYR